MPRQASTPPTITVTRQPKRPTRMLHRGPAGGGRRSRGEGPASRWQLTEQVCREGHSEAGGGAPAGTGQETEGASALDPAPTLPQAGRVAWARLSLSASVSSATAAGIRVGDQVWGEELQAVSPTQTKVPGVQAEDFAALARGCFPPGETGLAHDQVAAPRRGSVSEGRGPGHLNRGEHPQALLLPHPQEDWPQPSLHPPTYAGRHPGPQTTLQPPHQPPEKIEWGTSPSPITSSHHHLSCTQMFGFCLERGLFSSTPPPT